jgi:trehalose 6-phosphate phosphatase
VTAPLPRSLLEALDAFSRRDRVLVALDFDGVLAPIVEVPSEARSLPSSARAVSALTGLARVDVALVSGRALEDLRAVARPPRGAVLVASHGAEVDGAPSPLDDDARALLSAVLDDLEQVVAAHPGTHLETKPAGGVLHTRRAPREVATAAADAVRAGAGARLGVHTRTGKEVVELSVVRADKGSALSALRGRLGADAVLYAGDDTTDEDAFAVLRDGDVGVKVGDGETSARHRVDDPEQVSVLLAHLVDVLA